MTTNYTLTDSLPKDAGGAKHLAAINDQTSQHDYALLRGIGAKAMGSASRNLALLGVGSHTIGSAVDHGGGVGILGVYTESPSAIGTANMQMLRSDKEGALYVRPASGIVGYSTAASVQTHVSGSALLHGINILGADVNAGETIELDDGNDYKLGYVFSAASESISVNFSAGIQFNTSIKVRYGNTNASVSLLYSQY